MLASNNNICYDLYMAYKNIEDRRAASKRHYYAHKERYISRNVDYRESIRDLLRTIKEENPCTDCKKFYPYYVMDFDHLEDKDQNISFLAATGRIGALKKEILKCEVVCANCHRIRTHLRAKAK